MLYIGRVVSKRNMSVGRGVTYRLHLSPPQSRASVARTGQPSYTCPHTPSAPPQPHSPPAQTQRRNPPRRLIHPPAPRHILQALLLDLDIQQHQRMQPHIPILLDPIIKARRPPVLRKEHHRHRLPKVVQLQPARANGVHDGCVVDCAEGDGQLARAQQQVGVRGGSLMCVS